MATVRIPVPLRSFTGGQAAVEAAGDTAGEALQALFEAHPELRDQITDGDKMASSTYESINVMLGYEEIGELEGWATSISKSDILRIVRTWPAAISGGKQWNQPVGAEPPE
jgi:molybdopterin converting factor small subunit